MSPVSIPKTKARISRSITLHIAPDLGGDYAGMSPADLAALFSSKTKFGAAQSITVNDDIGLTRWRELDADKGGNVVEIVPGVEDISLTLNRVQLYENPSIKVKGSALEEIMGADYTSESLLTQLNAFSIVIEKRNPNTGTTKYEYFLGCRCKNNPITYDITKDGTVEQSMEVWAAVRK